MPKTRDFIILCFVLLIATIVSGFFLSSSPIRKESMSETLDGALFLEPRESYNLKSYTDESLDDRRDLFIEKVRHAYVSLPQQGNDTEDVEVVSLPPPPSTTTASTTYGNSGI